MTKESLQKYCDNENLKVKVLFTKPTKSEDGEYNLYYVVYTFDLDYNPVDKDYSNIEWITEPELDEIVEDEKEFVWSVEVRKGGYEE